MDIRTILIKFKNTHGYYSKNWDSIVSFTQSQKFNENIDIKFENIKNIRFIPYSNKQEFYIETGQVVTKNGDKIPVFQVKVHHNYFLIGINRSAVLQLNESLRMTPSLVRDCIAFFSNLNRNKHHTIRHAVAGVILKTKCDRMEYHLRNFNCTIHFSIIFWFLYNHKKNKNANILPVADCCFLFLHIWHK